ncbi:MAG: hypothetical protein A2X97_11610 [Bdellovibrionales bacterium GWA1_52_35]|nr:MAG: hypothetical protein A2X97_11610 [Bdellovibrionales bacterium GWA1_52_35]HCM39120.1 hypothetical protein [Bdellovibrionales bacterium]
MRLNIWPVLLMIAAGSLPQTGSASSELRAGKPQCEGAKERTLCRIPLSGPVKKGYALLMTDLNDVDETRAEGLLLGRTGMGELITFYASFLPRVYSLDSLAGMHDPTITVEIRSLSAQKAGFSESSTIRIIEASQASWQFVKVIAIRLFAWFGLGAILAFSITFVRNPSRQEMAISGPFTQLFYLGALYFCASMLKIPRMLSPSLLSPLQVYGSHAVFEALALCGLGGMINSLQFRHAKRKQEPYTLKILNWAGLLLSLALITAGIVQKNLYPFHVAAVALQAVLLMGFGLMFLRAWNLKPLLGYIHRSDLLLLSSLGASILLLAHDAWVYGFWHDGGRQYYIQYGIALILAVGTYRNRTAQEVSLRASRLTTSVRRELSVLTDPELKLSAICSQLQIAFSLSRITIVATADGCGRILCSAGPEALKRDLDPRPLGALAQYATEQDQEVCYYRPEVMDKTEGRTKFTRSSVILRIIDNNRLAALITTMAPPEQSINPTTAEVLSQCAAQLSLELSSILAEFRLLNQNAQLRSIAACTSGIVLEYLSDWGQLKSLAAQTDRAVLTADWQGATGLAELATRSRLAATALHNLKRETYRNWFAIRDILEFLTKDPRGDDLWLLSPREFQDPTLKAWGPVKVAMAHAVLLREYTAQLCASPHYSALGLAGSHIALAWTSLHLDALGTVRGKSIDTHSPQLSRVQRIRAASEAGSILIDCSESAVQEALKDPAVVTLPWSVSDPKEKLKDLTRLPQIRSLISLNEPYLDILKSRINTLIEESRQADANASPEEKSWLQAA